MSDPVRQQAHRLVLALALEDRMTNDPKITDALALARRTLAAIDLAREGEANARQLPQTEDRHR